MDKWKQIWNKDERINKIILECLIKADGFDSGAGSFNVDDWLIYIKEFYKKLNIKQNESIYDIGSGSGAFVYPLYLENHKVGGVDYSMNLIKLANTVMTNSEFENIEALNVNTTKKFDIVLSHSVFHYFKDLRYAEEVIEKMLEKANSKVAIFDINDKSKEEKYHIVRMGSMDKKEYKNKYYGLEHLFYDKEWFHDFAKKHGVKISIFDQTFQNYSNSSLRFNVIMEK